MTKHPDVFVGTARAEDGASIEVLVTGVDVRLTVRQKGHPNGVVVFLAPDDAIDLVGLLERALAT